MTKATRWNSRLGMLAIVVGALLCSGEAHAASFLDLTPPTGTPTLQPSYWGVRGYTVTFSTATSITGLDWEGTLAAVDSFHAEVWNVTTKVRLAVGADVFGTGANQFYHGPLSFTAAAGTAYILAIFWSNDNTYFNFKESPSFPYTVGNATVSANWSGPPTTDVFPTSSNSWGQYLRVDEGTPLSVTPAAPTTPPQGSIAFSASGGTGPYAWSLVSPSTSGGSIDPATGVYTAGPTGSQTDTVQVTDATSAVATTTVTVTAGISVTPSAPATTPLGSIAFGASGGSGTGFTWAFVTNASNGSLVSGTGAYVAGKTGSVVDVVAVTDSLGNTANVNIDVGAGVTIGPVAPSTPPQGNIPFTAAGGSGSGYVWSISPNLSNATIDAATGAYVAGSIADVSDTVNVIDSLGNTAQVNVSVGDGVAINPANTTLAPSGSTSFTAVGGSGTGYAFTLLSGPSGGSITGAGAYQAGAVPNVVDVVGVVDSLGNAATTDVTVGPGVSLLPLNPASPPDGTIAFAVSGGSGTGYTFSVSTNLSSGTIVAGTGAYTAGAIPSVTDVVTVTDSLGNAASTNVTIGVGVSILPVAPATPPRGAVTLAAMGGSGTGYVWSFATNASSGTIDPATGAYVAGPTQNVSDLVRVTDSLGNVATVTVTVGAGVTIAPALPATPPLGPVALSATGGSGTGFTWSITTQGSGASTIGAASGAYLAGAAGNSSDVVKVVDSLGNTASVDVSVGAGITITPVAPVTPPLGPLAFTATGGKGSGYAWTFVSNESGGTIDATTGAYVAGALPSVTDTIRVTDSLGNTTTATVNVGPGLSITPLSSSIAPLGTVAFSVSGGTGAGFVWSLSTNHSGGSIVAATGAYVAGTSGGVADVVSVHDSLDNTASASITVGPALAAAPTTATMPPRGMQTFTASGGSAGYAWSMQTNGSGGNVNATTGAYTAGPMPATADVVLVTDSNGATATALVTIGAGVTITPALPSVGPLGEVAFAAAGGSGTGYVWSLTTRASGAATITEAGAYVAGPTALTVDVAHVVDSLGNSADVSISVGAALAINPPQAMTFPRGSVAFSATGGGGTYTFSLATNASSGTINAQSGAYVAGSTPNVVDVVKVADQNGISVTANVAVGAGVSITPVVAAVKVRGTVQFASAGGSGTGYTWSVSTNLSGATISATGAYVGGPKGNVVDSVTVTDSVGSTATATVGVTVVAASVDGGVAEAGGPDAGVVEVDSGGLVPEGGAVVIKMGADAGTTGLALSGGGCGCKVTATQAPASSAVAGLSLLALALLRRRRQNERSAA